MSKSRLEIIDSIIEGLSAYNVTDDSVFTREFIGYKVDVMRETLIKNDFPKIGDEYYQSMCCIEVLCLEQGCTVEGLGFIASGDVVWYSELPKLITDVGWKDIKYVGPPDYLEGFTRMSLSGFQSHHGRLYTMGDIIYTRIGDRIYYANIDPKTKYVCLIGLLSSPEDECDYDENQDYPVPDIMKLEIAVKRDILSTYGILPDSTQDTSGQPVENSVSGSKTSAAKGK